MRSQKTLPPSLSVTDVDELSELSALDVERLLHSLTRTRAAAPAGAPVHSAAAGIPVTPLSAVSAPAAAVARPQGFSPSARSSASGPVCGLPLPLPTTGRSEVHGSAPTGVLPAAAPTASTAAAAASVVPSSSSSSAPATVTGSRSAVLSARTTPVGPATPASPAFASVEETGETAQPSSPLIGIGQPQRRGLRTMSGKLLLPLSDAEVLHRERHCMRPTIQERSLHHRLHYLRWDESLLRRGLSYRTNSIAARTTVSMSHTKALCLSVNIDPVLLGTVESAQSVPDGPRGATFAAPRGRAAQADPRFLHWSAGSDPADDHALPPLFMWQSPASVPGDAPAVLRQLGEQLQEQYDTFAPQRPLPTFNSPNPRAADLGVALSEARKEAGDAKVIFHYYARGVPSPHGGTIFLMNSSAGAAAYSPYSKMPLDTLRARVDSPLVFVADCADAGEIMRDFICKREEQEQRQQFLSREHQLKSSRQVSSTELDAMSLDVGVGSGLRGDSAGLRRGGGGSRGSLAGMDRGATAAMGGVGTANPKVYENFFFIGATGVGEGPGSLPFHPRLPSDILTSCLTTPVRMALLWFMVSRPALREVHPALLHLLPGALNDKKTPLGQLQWYFQTLTECIAWSALPLVTFSRLYREDIYLAPLFRGYLLAERIVVGGLGGALSVYPPMPPTHSHAIWDVWDNLVERCCVVLLGHVRPALSGRLSTLEAREWLDVRATRWKYERESAQRRQYSVQMAYAGGGDADSGGCGTGGGAGDARVGPAMGGLADTTPGGFGMAAGVASAGGGGGFLPPLPSLSGAPIVLPNLFKEELRGVAAVVERVTRQSFRLPAVMPPSPGAAAVASSPLDDEPAGKAASQHSVFHFLPRGEGGGNFSAYRNTSLLSHDPYGKRGEDSAFDPLYAASPTGESAGSACGGGGSFDPYAVSSPSSTSSKSSAFAALTAATTARRSLPGPGPGSAYGDRLLYDRFATSALPLAYASKGEYVANRYVLSSSAAVSGFSLGHGDPKGVGDAGEVMLAFPFIERAPVLLQGLLVLAHREKATELVCRLVDTGAPAVLQCAETNLYRIVLDRFWSRADLRFLMPSTLFIYCKSCYADPELIGTPKQRDIAIKACVEVLQCPVNIPGPTEHAAHGHPPPHQQPHFPRRDAGTAPARSAPTASEPGAWQHDVLGPYASATGQRLLAVALLTLVAVHSDDGREACHRAGALQLCCQLLAVTANGGRDAEGASDGLADGLSEGVVDSESDAQVWRRGLFLVSPTLSTAEAVQIGAAESHAVEQRDVARLYRLNLVALLMALLHNWSPNEDEGEDSEEPDTPLAEEEAAEETGGAAMNSNGSGIDSHAAYWCTQLAPLDGEVRELPATNARVLKASLRVVHAALEGMIYSRVATLRGAALKGVCMVIATPAVDEHTKCVYVGAVLQRVYEGRVPPFEGNADLRLEATGAAYVAFRFFMEQLQTEMPLDEIRDWVARWVFRWHAMRKKGSEPAQPGLRRDDVVDAGPTPADRGAAASSALFRADGQRRVTRGAGHVAGGASAVASAGVSLRNASMSHRSGAVGAAGPGAMNAAGGKSMASSQNAFPTQQYEHYLPPLSNLIRLFIEHAHDNCPYLAAHVRKVLLEDLGFLQVPWFDQNSEGYGGTPPGVRHALPSYPPPPLLPSVQSHSAHSRSHHHRHQQQQPHGGAGRAASIQRPGQPPLSPVADGHRSPPADGVGRSAFTDSFASLAEVANPSWAPPEENPTAYRHFIAGLLRGATGNYGKGRATFTFGAARLDGGGGGDAGPLDYDPYRRGFADAGGPGDGMYGRLYSRGGGVASAHGDSGRSRATAELRASAAAAAATAAAAAAAASSQPPSAVGAGASAAEGGWGAYAASSPYVADSPVHRAVLKTLEPDNVVLCAVSWQDAATVTSFVYAALGFLRDLLLVRPDDYDARNLFCLDRDSALQAYLLRVSAELRQADSHGVATVNPSSSTTTTTATPVFPATDGVAEDNDEPLRTAGSGTAEAAGDRASRALALVSVGTVEDASDGADDLIGGGTPAVVEAAFHPSLPHVATATDQGCIHVWLHHGAAPATRSPGADTDDGSERGGTADGGADGRAARMRLLCCFRPLDVMAKSRGVVRRDVQMQYIYSPWREPLNATAAAAAAAATMASATGRMGRRPDAHGMHRGGGGASPLASPVGGRHHRDPTSAAQPSVSGTSVRGTSAGAGGARAAAAAASGVSGLHFLDASYNTLLCAVHTQGAVEVFANYADPTTIRRVTAFETSALSESVGLHSCLSSYQSQSALLYLTASDHSIASWDLGAQHLASIGYGRGDYDVLPTVLTAHPYNPHLVAVGAGAVYVYDRRERTSARAQSVFDGTRGARALWAAVNGESHSARGVAGGMLDESLSLCLHAQYSSRFPHLLSTGYSGASGPVLLWDDRMCRCPLHRYATHPARGPGGGDLSSVRHIDVQPLSKRMLTLATTSSTIVLTEPFAATSSATAPQGSTACTVARHDAFELSVQPRVAAFHPFLRLFALGLGSRLSLFAESAGSSASDP